MRKVLGDTGFIASAKLGENKYFVDFILHLIYEQDEDYELKITVKWDGCSNWQTNDHCAAHGCEREHLVNAGEALALCWDWASEIMGDNFCG